MLVGATADRGRLVGADAETFFVGQTIVNSVELLRSMSMLWNNADCEDVQVVVIIS